MIGKVAAVLLSGLLVACVQAPPPAAVAPPPPAPAPAPPPPAPPPAAAAPGPLSEAVSEQRIVDIRGAGCEAFLGLDQDDRIMAAMFYIGYHASRFGQEPSMSAEFQPSPGRLSATAKRIPIGRSPKRLPRAIAKADDPRARCSRFNCQPSWSMPSDRRGQRRPVSAPAYRPALYVEVAGETGVFPM